MDQNDKSPLHAPHRRGEWTRFGKTLCILVTLGTFISACMSSPLNNQELASKDETISFEGFVPTPGGVVYVQAQNDFGEWIDVGMAQPGSEAGVDSAGDSWYHWATDNQLPRFPAFWRQVPGQRRLSASLRAKAHPYAGENWFELATFDTTAGECVEAWSSSGIQGIINNCKSPQTPVVTVTAPCGAEGQACCEENPCDQGSFCKADKCLAVESTTRHVRVDADGVHSGSWVGLANNGEWSFKTHLHNGRFFGANYVVGCVLDTQIDGQTIGFTHSGYLEGTGIGGDGGDDDKETRGTDPRITERWDEFKNTGMRCNMRWSTSFLDATLETLGLVVQGVVIIGLLVVTGGGEGRTCFWRDGEYVCTWGS
jgi:hypothetical protein